MTTWTKERLAIMAARWKAGDSAGVIAKALGTTRNAIMGRIYRDGLARSPAQPRVKISRTYRPRKPRKPQRSPETPSTPNLTNPVSIMSLGLHACRWPLGDPLREGFGYCGVDHLDGQPYCQFHDRLAHTQRPEPQTEAIVRKYA